MHQPSKLTWASCPAQEAHYQTDVTNKKNNWRTDRKRIDACGLLVSVSGVRFVNPTLSAKTAGLRACRRECAEVRSGGQREFALKVCPKLRNKVALFRSADRVLHLVSVGRLREPRSNTLLADRCVWSTRTALFLFNSWWYNLFLACFNSAAIA